VSILIAIITLLLLALAVAIVSAPFRAGKVLAVSTTAPAEQDAGAVARGGDRDELEAAREAKYREIRDAELDFRTGKLSREDFEAIDSDLRAEALAILNEIEAIGAVLGDESAGADEDAPS
jgi:hypothetical protein